MAKVEISNFQANLFLTHKSKSIGWGGSDACYRGTECAHTEYTYLGKNWESVKSVEVSRMAEESQ